MVFIETMALNLNNYNAVFNKIQQDKKCYQDMYELMVNLTTNEANLLSPVSTEREVLSNYLTLLGKGNAYGQDGLLAWDYSKAELRTEFEKIDTAVGLTPAQKQKIKDDYLEILPFLNDDPALDGANNNGNNNGNAGNAGSNAGSNYGGQNFIQPYEGGRKLRKHKSSKKTRKGSKKARKGSKKSRRV